MKNVLALERVSTDRQDLAKQGEENQEVSLEYGLNIVDTLRLKGVSGTAMLSHAQVKEILGRLQQPSIGRLHCPAVDRLFRPKQGPDFGIGNYFQNAGKMLWTKYDGVLDLSTDEGWGRFMEAGVSAGKELRRIRSRFMSGKKTKRRLGRNVSGSESLPDGILYERVVDSAGKTKDGKWSYDEEEVAKIREAYRILFSDHTISLSALAQRVGWKWSGSLRRCLQNTCWRGVRTSAPMGNETEPFEYKLPLEPVLTPEQWNLAQVLLQRRRTWSKETSDPRHLGAGLLVCSCGQRYYTHGDGRRGQHDEYLCASRHPKGPGCGAARLRREIVDRAIEQLVSDRLTDAAFLAKVFARVKPGPQPDLQARERELAKLSAQRAKWIKQFNADRITEKEFEEQMDAVKKAAHEVEARMPVTARPVIDQRAVVLGLTRWAVRFAKIVDFEQKRTELKRAIRRIPVIDGAIADVAISGTFLGELAHTNSEQPSRGLSNFGVPADILLALPQPIRLRV